MINSYDIDGVIYMGDAYTGLKPGPNDIIITGRSALEEADYTHKWLQDHGIYNQVYMNPVTFAEKTREGAGYHKASTILKFLIMGIEIGIHFEDDPIQADIIEKETPVKVVRLVHNLVEKENAWHGSIDDAPNYNSV